MKKASFSLGLIIASNILIIGIGMVYGLHLFSPSQNTQTGTSTPNVIGELKEFSLKK